MLTALVMALAISPDLMTRAEKTNFVETPRYEETLDYCRRLEKESPWIRVTSFGRSPQGRDLILVIASKERAFDPAAAAKTGKPVILIQAGIHAGEIDGKDAGMMLLRDVAVTRQRAALLDHAIILFMPIYNVDGHERFGRYNRINQNGPREMGWRVTSRNLNLNRDYMKADAVETRAWLKLFTSWWPDLVIDCHVTDGADYRYDVTYFAETGPNAPPSIAAWTRTAVDQHVAPALEAAGHPVSSYIFLKEDTDPAAGLATYPPTPRFSTSYTVLQNRAAFLIETHMLKDYRTRVIGTYDTLRALLEEVNRDPEALRTAVRAADVGAAGRGPVALTFRVTDKTRLFKFRGIEYQRELSEISGAMRIIYGTRPLDLDLTAIDTVAPAVTVEKPVAYIVPPQWTEAIEVLATHGLKLQRLTAPVTGTFDLYRLTDPNWAAAPFEGRHQVTFKTARLKGIQRTWPAGSIVVPLDQRSSTVAAHLLEPQGPDSFVSWGFFDSIFEQKEYAEGYTLEALARKMLEADPKLGEEFETKVRTDREFAASARARLNFFYERSPYWDQSLNVYPIARIVTPFTAPRVPLPPA